MDVDGGWTDGEYLGSIRVLQRVGCMRDVERRECASSVVWIGGGDGKGEACTGRQARAKIGSARHPGAGNPVQCERVEHQGVACIKELACVGGDGCVEARSLDDGANSGRGVYFGVLRVL